VNRFHLTQFLVCLLTVIQAATIEMSFFRNPFVFLTIAVIGGILFREETGWDTVVLIVLGLLTLFYILLRKRVSKLPAIVLLFFVFGFLYNNPQVLNFPNEASVTAVVEIIEQKNSSKDWNQAIGQIHHIRDQGFYQPSGQKILLYTNSDALRRGMSVLAILSPKAIQNSGNPGSFNAETYWRSKGIRHIGFLTDEDYRLLSFQKAGMVHRFSDQIRSFIRSALSEFSPDKAGILNALLLGDKGDLSTEVREQFANAGAMHLLAVSGLHIGIIAFLLLFLFQQFPRLFSNLMAHVLVVIILWGYALITGFSPSVTRAVLMFSLLILSRLARGQYDPINVLFFSAFIVILINPLVVYDIGFQLSYLAVLGIFIFYARFEGLLPVRNKIISWLWKGTCIGLSAQLATAPLTLYYFHQFPNYFVISNLGIMLIAAILMFTSILFVITFKLTPLKVVLFFMLSFLVSILIQFIGWIDGLPWSVARGFELNILQVLIYFIGIFFLISSKQVKWFRFAGIAFVFAFVFWIQFDRYQNLTSDHLIIANNDLPISFLRLKNKTVCLTTEPEMRKKDLHIIKDYSKIYPGEMDYAMLPPNSFFALKGLKENVRVERKENGIKYLIGEKVIILKTGFKYSNEAKLDSIILIAMPYLHSNSDHDLISGAYITPL
jgi:competence protein ComEC